VVTIPKKVSEGLAAGWVQSALVETPRLGQKWQLAHSEIQEFLKLVLKMRSYYIPIGDKQGRILTRIKRAEVHHENFI